LYLDGAAGAGAELFDALLEASPGAPTALPPEARERVVDWWATALDQEARTRPESDRQPIYQRIRARMRAELATTPSSAAASYWLAAAALAQGDPQAAWDAAMAAWVRAPLAGDRGAALRGDLDLLVEHAIIPERSRQLAQSVEACKAEWDAFKQKWER
jgi:hypothetical protein